MNTDTGAIAKFETRADAVRAGYKIQLSEAEAEELIPLNRAERRKRIAELRASAGLPVPRFKVRKS